MTPIHTSNALALRTNGFLDRNARALSMIAFALVTSIFLFSPTIAHAAAGQLQSKGDSALSWLKIAVGIILTVAVLGSGVLAAFGQMSWKTVGQVLIGCIVAGIAAAVVSGLYG